MTNNRYNPISYQGPKNYRSGSISNTGVVSNVGASATTGSVGMGYADVDYVKKLFEQMSKDIASLVSDLETDLRKYSLIIPTDDTTLKAAYDVTFEGMGTLSGYVHFFMYKTLWKNSSSNAANYIRHRYETEMRNPNGTNSLDVLKMVLYVSGEMTRMKEFIDGFIGEVDDTSEFRVLESFQNWAENAVDIIAKLRQTFDKETSAELPVSELDQLDENKASGAQALFKVKLNVLNNRIRTSLAEMDREYNVTADTFYNKYLGPSLRFRIKVSRDLANGIKTPILQAEIENTVASLDSNYAVQLADLAKRVSHFGDKCFEMLSDMAVRDTYVAYIQQLSSRGVTLKPTFSNIAIPEAELGKFDSINLIKDFRSLISYEDNFTHNHSELSGLDDDEAHPQYLLRSGGTVSGDIILESGVKIDGIDLSEHRHTGQDGSLKIRGTDIEFSSITELQIDTTTSTTSVPYNLEVADSLPLISPIGIASVNVQVAFDMTDPNVAGYEFEIIELS